MRTTTLFSLLATLCVFQFVNATQRPIPPGVREADKQSTKPLEPAMSPSSNAPDPAKLKQEAQELAQLSAEVAADLSLVAKGQLPKDLADKLKRIEKLAKHLRSELSR